MHVLPNFFRRMLAILLTCAAIVAHCRAASDEPIRLLARHSCGPGGAEIIAYSNADAILLATVSDSRKQRFGVEVISLADPEQPQLLRFIAFDPGMGSAFNTTVTELTSVAADPLGRGIGAATLLPRNTHTEPGMLVVFDYNSGRILSILAVGQHPDSVTFSRNGRYILTADEGEFKPRGPQTAGSLSVVDLNALNPDVSHANLRQSSVSTYDFSRQNCVEGLDFSGLRRHHGDATQPITVVLEPEYLAVLDSEVFVSLQENNAIAVFDLQLRKWVRVFDLGVIEQLIDASDRDGAFGSAAIRIDKRVAGMPMPDTIAAFSFAGRRMVATANEGDARAHDAGDVMRLKHAGTDGPALCPQSRAQLKQLFGSDPKLDHNLGRLQISNRDGDTTRDGRIDRPTMFGTRSFSIWDADSGALVFDSGSFLETYVAENDPGTFNMNAENPASIDSRSDNKGPEPEAMAVATIANELWIAVAAERQNGIFLFRATDPAMPEFFAYTNPRAAGDWSPESLLLIPAAQGAAGRHLLVAGFEGSGTVLVYAFNPDYSH